MGKRKSYINYFFYTLFFFTGLSIGFSLIWPGILRTEDRNCFFKIIKDGSDGNVSIGTIFSIDPKYLLKLNNAKSRYRKILLIGDFCFRK